MLVFIIFVIGVLKFLSKNMYHSSKSNLLQPTNTQFYRRWIKLDQSSTDQYLSMLRFYENVSRSKFFFGHSLSEGVFVTKLSSNVGILV